MGSIPTFPTKRDNDVEPGGGVSGDWLMFLLPAAAIPVASYLAGRRSPAVYYTPANVQGRCLVLLIAGAAWGVFCLVRLSSLTPASTLFLTDPSCVAGPWSAKVRAGAPCRSETAAIVRTNLRYGSRSAYTYYLTLARNDGTEEELGLADTGGGRRVFEQAQAAPGIGARAEIFEGRVVAVATNEGVASTQWDPRERIRILQGSAFLAAGIFVAALIEVARSWRFL